MAIIKNADGTIGNTSSANKYMMDNNLAAKYRLLQSYSSTRKNEIVKAGGTGASHKEVADTTYPNILNFLTKLEKFTFAPPSDNLWTIKIDLAYNNSSSSHLLTLYNNILEVNKGWSDVLGTRWKIDLEQPSRTSQNTGEKYIKEFIGSNGLFLAQDVQFTPMSINVIDKPWNQPMNNNMFLNFGNIATGRSESKSLKISFLISNWDIGDILFDPWISAVGQKGLIEDGNSSIKAKITISEYSAGMPIEYNKNKPFSRMECRKEYIFNDCVPVSRSEVKKDYEFSQAGIFKKTIIDFRYEDYEIHYKY